MYSLCQLPIRSILHPPQASHPMPVCWFLRGRWGQWGGQRE